MQRSDVFSRRARDRHIKGNATTATVTIAHLI